MRGNVYRSRLRHQFCECHRPRQPWRFCSRTRSAASANVGTPSVRRFSERGSSPGPRQPAVGEGQLAGLGERDERYGAGSEFSAVFADDEPLDLASGPGRLAVQVQSVAVGVPSWPRRVDHGCGDRLTKRGTRP